MGGQPFTLHTDKLVIDDDDTDSDTAIESDLSSKSMSFLHRVNDRLRRILDQSSKYSMQDTDKHSLIANVHVFHIGCICIHVKGLLRKFTLHQKIQGTISL